jgi:PAS domain S-box-containing protein
MTEPVAGPSHAPDADIHTAFRPLSDEQAALLEHSPMPAVVLDRAFRIRFVNRAAANYGQVDRSTLVGRNVWECFPMLRDTELHRHYASVLESGEPARFERYDATSDRWQSVHAFPADGGLVAVLDDITAQQRMVEELKRSEGTLRLAQEAGNIGSFYRDLRTGTGFWSDQLIRMCGLDPTTFDQSLLTRNARRLDFVHPDDRELVRDAWKRTIETGETQVVRNRMVRMDGAERHLLTTVMLVRDHDGQPMRLVGAVRDVTDEVRADEERARLDAQMQQAQKRESLGVLAGGIAHDFNNLLVGILGNASLAMLEVEPMAQARASILEIERAARKAADLTRQLLAYAGKGRYVVESVSASDIIQDMASLLRSAVSRDASLQIELEMPLPPIDVDVNQFRQVVMNLVTNASDALEERPGAIGVRTGRLDITPEFLRQCVPGHAVVPCPCVFVEVRDTGTGMDANTVRRMFEPFFSTKFTGRGLGLAATMGIMLSHRGAIHVDSDVGAGTCVTLLFPVTASHVASTQGSAQATGTSGHLLLVDDEHSVRTVGAALLRRRGFTVTEARDGQHAMTLFEEAPERFALVLLDLTMPVMNGEQTLLAMRAQHPEVRVLLMSGYNEQDVSRTFHGGKPSGFLQKPFSADELYAAVTEAIGG